MQCGVNNLLFQHKPSVKNLQIESNCNYKIIIDLSPGYVQMSVLFLS